MKYKKGINKNENTGLALVFVFLLAMASPVLAHQPRLVSGDVTEISNPEVSQAFYANLNGSPHFYSLLSESNFTLLVQLLVPDIEGIDKDVSATITFEHENHQHEEGQENGDELLYTLDGTSHNWTPEYEPFGGDSYFEGPSIKTQAEAGTYTIEVFSPDNQGKYVLVVGEREEFPLDEFINTVLTLPALKQDFFGKPAWTAYFNLIGVFLLVILAVIIAVIYIIIRLYRRFFRRK